MVTEKAYHGNMTPLEEYPRLAETLGLKGLYFKREDLHPYGSHKGRSIPVMIDLYRRKGDSHFAISSSGNAALAAALYIIELNGNEKAGLDLDIFVGNHIAPKKLEKLQTIADDAGDDSIRILKKERPLQALTQAVAEGKRGLRQSNDETALIGYGSLAEELEAAPSVKAVFLAASSGTTAEALAGHFLKENKSIQVHIVQTSSCHPMADDFENYDGPEEESIADAIVDRTAIRKPVLVPLLKKSGGWAWVASNEDIISAQKIVKEKTDLDISTNSALSVVGAMQAVYRGWEIDGAVVCLICGD